MAGVNKVKLKFETPVSDPETGAFVRVDTVCLLFPAAALTLVDSVVKVLAQNGKGNGSNTDIDTDNISDCGDGMGLSLPDSDATNFAEQCQEAYRAWWRAAPQGVKQAEKATATQYLVDFFLAVGAGSAALPISPLSDDSELVLLEEQVRGVASGSQTGRTRPAGEELLSLGTVRAMSPETGGMVSVSIAHAFERPQKLAAMLGEVMSVAEVAAATARYAGSDSIRT